MLPISIGVFNQTSASPAPPQNFQFNPAYDLISSDNQGVLGAKLSSYDGVLIPPLLPSDPFATNPNEIVVAPTGNLIQVPAGQTITSCSMRIEDNNVASVIHEIRTIPEVTPTISAGFTDHVMWTINGNYDTHQARGGAGPPAGAGDPTLIQGPEEGGGGGGGEGGGDPFEPIDPFEPTDPIGGEIGAPIGGGGFGGGGDSFEPIDPFEPPVSGGGNETTVDLMPLLNTSGDMNSALFWQWFAGGAKGNITFGANTSLRCRFDASNNLGAKISLDLIWTAA